MKYCTKCGNELLDEAVICVKCGCPVENGNSSKQNVVCDVNLLKTLSSRIYTDAVIWIVIGAIQLILGIFAEWFLAIVGVLNIVMAVKDIKYSKTIIDNPVGIVKTFEPLVGPIITLIYNVVFGGVIGVVGSIYYFIAVRGYVMQNKEFFESLDNSGVEL